MAARPTAQTPNSVLDKIAYVLMGTLLPFMRGPMVRMLTESTCTPLGESRRLPGGQFGLALLESVDVPSPRPYG